MATGLLHFPGAVSRRSAVTGHNRRLNWQIKQRMSGIDAEPRVPRHNRFNDRPVATWREERRLEGQATWKQTSAFLLLSVPLWSSLLLPSLFLSVFFFLTPALDLVLDLFSSTLSLHLFPLAFFLSALLPWLQHHPYMKCICRGYKRGENGE